MIFFFFFLLLRQTKKVFGTFDLLFILPLLFISTLLISPTIPSLLSQHPNLYSFYLNAYLGSLEPQTFGFPLDSCPDALPFSHVDLDASSTIFLQCNELNRGHPTFFYQSQDELRTKESEFVHFWTNHKRGTCGEKLFISINEETTKHSLRLGATNF